MGRSVSEVGEGASYRDQRLRAEGDLSRIASRGGFPGWYIARVSEALLTGFRCVGNGNGIDLSDATDKLTAQLEMSRNSVAVRGWNLRRVCSCSCSCPQRFLRYDLLTDRHITIQGKF